MSVTDLVRPQPESLHLSDAADGWGRTPAAVEATFRVMRRAVDNVSTDCRAVSETLKALDDALHLITQSSGPAQGANGFGLVGLPIAGALRAAKGIASQYVKQQTGLTLDVWTDLVASSSVQFSTYVSRLETVAELSQRYHTLPDDELDVEQARADLDVLLDVRWQTQAWKQVLSRVTQLGQLVEAILEANLGDEADGPEAGLERGSGFTEWQRRFREVQSKTVEKSGDLKEWVLKPFLDIRNRVSQLPGQIEQLAGQVTQLELLFDLEIADFEARLGEISPEEARIVGLRVAAGVVLPELARELAESRQHAHAYESYLDRLRDARTAGDMDERAYAILSDDYVARLEDARYRIAALESQADVWRRDGPAVLDACTDWVTVELDVLALRHAIEQDETAVDRAALLRRERERFEEVSGVLASL